MRAAALGLALGAMRAAPALTAAPADPHALPLRCANESAQLFPVEIEVLDAGGTCLPSEYAWQGAIAGNDAKRIRSFSH